jgi:hypothetical protein
MPVSKKRKKDGKAVQRTKPPEEHAEHPHGPDSPQVEQPQRGGKPSNPFVAQAQMRRGAQRGR